MKDIKSDTEALKKQTCKLRYLCRKLLKVIRSGAAAEPVCCTHFSFRAETRKSLQTRRKRISSISSRALREAWKKDLHCLLSCHL